MTTPSIRRLVLKRRPGERLRIMLGAVEVMVTVEYDYKLVIEAPDCVRVLRAEVIR